MAEQQDNAQRTEEPTPKRLQEALRKGDAPKSQEAITVVMLLAGALAVWLLSAGLAQSLALLGSPYLEDAHAMAVDAGALQQLFARLAGALAGVMGAFAGLILLAALGANLGQAPPVFTAERMKPSLQKISPLAGAKRIFGATGLFNFGKGVGKIIIVGAILGIALWPDRYLLTYSMSLEGAALLGVLRSILLKILALTIGAMCIVASLDYAFQRHNWKKRLRMTKEEVRRELKETEGDPQIKARQRMLREQRSRKRMVAAVKDATVLIMNPTHYAVALDYEMGAERAPVCLAKGVDETALRMREAARAHNVPIVENPPLARALHATIDVDEEIPLEHYEAVAAVIGVIMRKAQAARPLQ